MSYKNARSALQKLFVYGTLKRGEPNHHFFKNSNNGYAKYICKAATTKKMPLVIATRYNIPFLLDKPGQGNYVAGEIFEVDDRMMDKIENLEGRDLLTRDKQEMNMGLQEGIVPCWVFLLKDYPEYLDQLPYLSEYKNTARHPYGARSEREEKVAKNDLLYNLFI
ncbi:troponin C-akin-1 protein [Phlebotomus argentipes]|uniref:troponin C-akin-1 protein n=1 Tax=Phlebotomus argentipes TaxID=94469 RepID=UPI0028930F05|nr:troponin C-akin-1 protein [Phlebotomus argentipes]